MYYQQQQNYRRISSHSRLPPISECRLSLNSIMAKANLNEETPVSHHRQLQPLTDRQPTQTKQVHSSILEFKQNFKNMFTNSKYGLRYMQKKVFHRLEPL